MTIGLYFGTQTGKTETVCGIIKEQLGDAVANAKDVTIISNNDNKAFVFIFIFLLKQYY